MCPYPLEVSDHNIKGPSHPDLNNHSNIPCKLSYKCANTRGFREIRTRPFSHKWDFSPVEAKHNDIIGKW